MANTCPSSQISTSAALLNKYFPSCHRRDKVFIHEACEYQTFPNNLALCLYFLRIMTCRIQQHLLQGSCYETATSYFYQLFKQTLLAFLWANTCVPKQTCLKCTTWVHFQENCSLFEACSLHALMLLPSQHIIFVICWRNCTCFSLCLIETMKDIDLRHVCFPFLSPQVIQAHCLCHVWGFTKWVNKL